MEEKDKLLLYADDLVLLAENMQLLLDMLYVWCRDSTLRQVNENKSIR